MTTGQVTCGSSYTSGIEIRWEAESSGMNQHWPATLSILLARKKTRIEALSGDTGDKRAKSHISGQGG